jgi:hypothetical protein
MIRKRSILAVLIIAIVVFSVDVAPVFGVNTDTGAPPQLEGWSSWVLHGMEDQLCPPKYNGSPGKGCVWPARLNLEVNGNGGRFRQSWLVLAESWLPLPGGEGAWPEAVLLDGQLTPVVDRSGIPAVKAEPGNHEITGEFSWTEMPEMIQVSPASGLVDLKINNQLVKFPVIEKNGRLWLQRRVRSESQEDREDVQIQRLVTDSIPMTVTTLIRLNVSGRAREIGIKGAMLEGGEPMQLDAPLPARLEKDDVLSLQARPGRWTITVVSRMDGPVDSLGPATTPYGQEIWAFQAQNHLRLVNIEGAASVDPSQTDVPGQWKNLPVYVIQKGDTLTFKVIRRGDPDPAPDRLSLLRTWWLDFDGGGLTVQDQVTGTMSRQWYLAMNPPAELGRVSVNGEDRLITAQGPDAKPGVELRQGNLKMTAESRYEGFGKAIPAVGWDHDFQSLHVELNLPPGWRLFSASGVDAQPDTWLRRWTLLDFFIVLIIAIAVFKLGNWYLGLLALITLGLIYHEPGAPRIVWLNILAATALLKVLPQGWFYRLASLWRLLAIVVLLALAIPFMVTQVRVGLYPQLDQRRFERSFGLGAKSKMAQAPLMYDAETGRESQVLEEAPAPSTSESLRSEVYPKAQKKGDYYERKKKLLAQDPNALIQTGPGLPEWRWRSISLVWNGPVDKDQTVTLSLISPLVNMVLCFARVILLALLIVGLIDLKRWWSRMGKGAVAAMAVILLLPMGAWAAQIQQQQQNNMPNIMPPAPIPSPPGSADGSLYPSQQMLDELRNRLLEPPDCLPHCANFPRMSATVTDDAVNILIEVHAAVQVSVPLPGVAKSWLPQQVLLDDSPATGLARDDDGTLWLLVPEGLHRVTLVGAVPPGDAFQLPLPLRPNQVEITAEGWDVQGVRPNGAPQPVISLTRLKKSDSQSDRPAATVVPPFVSVERILNLGLDWEVETRVRRLTPTGNPVVMVVPLLKGESVTTAGITVKDGKARITMDPKARGVVWTSSLEVQPEIKLAAPTGLPLTETWTVNASPIWHLELSGIPVVHHQDAEGTWRPTWRPWPGEEVAIAVTKPKAIPGRTLTILSSILSLTPGERFTNSNLSMKVRASQGGQHKVVLPEGAKLQVVKIKGKTQPIGQENREVVLPLSPGAQDVYLEWNSSLDGRSAIRSPQVDIGADAVNATVEFHMPRDRWILWTSGPRLGPAVLFWSYLVVVVLAALALGRIRWTPLKTRHWLLLGLGLTQIHPLLAIVIVGWILILATRERKTPPDHWFSFDMFQILLIVWTVVALIGLYTAVERGLLGIPDMQIAGNGSYDFLLRWTQDRIGHTMPEPVVFSLPRMAYHVLMLVWALWLAFSLVRWLRWGWHAFSHEGLWKMPKLKKRIKAPAQDAGDFQFGTEPPAGAGT